MCINACPLLSAFPSFLIPRSRIHPAPHARRRGNRWQNIDTEYRRVKVMTEGRNSETRTTSDTEAYTENMLSKGRIMAA